MADWSAEEHVVYLKRAVLSYSTCPYDSPVARSLSFTGLPSHGDRLAGAFDILSALAEPYRLDPSLLFSSVYGMSVVPQQQCELDGLVAVNLDLRPYRAMQDLLTCLGSVDGVLPAVRAADTASMLGLRGMASDVLRELEELPDGFDPGTFTRLWDSEDLIGSAQDAWEPSDKVGPLLCRDVLEFEAGQIEEPDFIPVSPRQDEVGNFPLRLIYDHGLGRMGLRLHFLIRVAMVPSSDVGRYPDRCRLDMPRDGLPSIRS